LQVTHFDLTGNKDSSNSDSSDPDSSTNDDSTSRYNPNRTEQSSRLSLRNESPTDNISDIAFEGEIISEESTLADVTTPEPCNLFPDVHVPKPASEEAGNLPIVNPLPLLEKQLKKTKSVPKKTKSATNGKKSSRRTVTPASHLFQS
jgi:hypothetical protein